VAVTNGEGFKMNQDQYGNVKYAAGIDIKPISGWITRFYYDNAPSDNPAKNGTQQLFSLFTGFQLPKVFRIGAEYNYHRNHAHIAGSDLYGFSGYAAYVVSKKIELFARYDHLKSNTLPDATEPWNLNNNGKTRVAGIQYIPVKNIALSVSYQGWQPDLSTAATKNAVALSFEFKQ